MLYTYQPFSSHKSTSVQWPKFTMMLLVTLTILFLRGERAKAQISFAVSGPSSAQSISSFDFAPGNSLSRSGVGRSTGEIFQTYFQAVLGGFTDPASGLSFTPPGFLTSFEFTIVASITERVVDPAGAFELAPMQSPNSFLEIYYQDGPNSNSLAGTGFNDGRLIYRGTPDGSMPNRGVFNLLRDPNNGMAITGNFDQFSADNYPNVFSITGDGDHPFAVTTDFIDREFFLTPIDAITFATHNKTPFDSTDPSGQFVSQSNGAVPDIIPALSGFNGVGPDIQFQTDASISFLSPVPEPSSLALLGIGLAGIGLKACRRHKGGLKQCNSR